jgi:hypothetical protein
MRYGIPAALLFLISTLSASPARALEPYVSVEAGIAARDVSEEGKDLAGFKFKGEAVTTRLLSRVGVDLDRFADVYFQGGGVDLSVDEFDNFDSNLEGAYGAGLRVNLYRSGYRDDLTVFAEGNWLRFTANDKIQTLSCPLAGGCAGNEDAYLPRIADEKITWNEYTALIGASGRSEMGSLYGGIRLSFVDGKDKVRAGADSTFSEALRSTLDLKEDDNFGLFFGVNLFLDRMEKSVVSLEASLIDQDSFRVALRRYF